MLLLFLISIALVLGAIKYIAEVSISRQLYKVYKHLYYMPVSYLCCQGLPDKLFIYLELYYLYKRYL
jgi:hypothetical protein